MIPLGVGEDPDDAIGRVYEGGDVIEVGENGPQLAPFEHDGPEPDRDFGRWRAEVLRRLQALPMQWRQSVRDERIEFEADGFDWQIDVGERDVLLCPAKFERSPDCPVDDGRLLDVFLGLDCILHDPNGMYWIHIDHPDRTRDLVEGIWQ